MSVFSICDAMDKIYSQDYATNDRLATKPALLQTNLFSNIAFCASDKNVLKEHNIIQEISLT